MDVQRKLQVVCDAVPVGLLARASLIVVYIAHAQDAALVKGPLGDLRAEVCIPRAIQSAATALRTSDLANLKGLSWQPTISCVACAGQEKRPSRLHDAICLRTRSHIPTLLTGCAGRACLKHAAVTDRKMCHGGLPQASTAQEALMDAMACCCCCTHFDRRLAGQPWGRADQALLRSVLCTLCIMLY